MCDESRLRFAFHNGKSPITEAFSSQEALKKDNWMDDLLYTKCCQDRLPAFRNFWSKIDFECTQMRYLETR